ncbi:MAG: SPASM domain-containing protein [Clostridia bacterium]|nr:SPASM domain-containing protein [Clostridia bacterium]
MRFKRIYIEITNICNLSCSFCPKLNRPPKEMDINEFERVISEIRPLTDYVYLHIKGEPLAHSKFDNVLTICDRENLMVNITTNGTLINNNIETLKKHKCIRQLNISLHSMENPIKAQEYVDNIINATKILKNHFMISYRIWTYDNNNSCNKYIIDRIEKEFNIKVDLSLNRFKIENNLYFSVGNTFQWPSPTLPVNSEKGFCLGGRNQLGILSDGTVVPCCLDSEGDINLGNIFIENIENILENSRFKAFYDGFSNGKAVENLCLHCTFRDRFIKS